MSRQNRKNFKKKTVFDYWYKRKEELGPLYGHAHDLIRNQCFACGNTARLEVAHIVPLVWGGPDTIENVHILCIGCHVESEGLKLYWDWLRWKRKHEYKDPATRWVELVQKCGIVVDDELANRSARDPVGIFKEVRNKVYFTVND